MGNELKNERSLVMIKPDGVQRSLIGEIIKRYESVGLKLVGLKMVVPTEQQAIEHYYNIGGDAWLESVGAKARVSYEKKGLESPYKTNRENGEAVMKANAAYISAGPVVLMVWQGMQAVEIIRKLSGFTEPLTSPVGTIRGDLAFDSFAAADTDSRSVRNLIHASGTVEEAKKEIALWFKPAELSSYRLLQDEVLYDATLKNFKE